MKYNKELSEAVLLKRYKRFFADIELNDQDLANPHVMTIHVPNTGSLKSVIDSKQTLQKCLYSKNDNPDRKLKGTLEALQTSEGFWVGVNTSMPNKLIEEAANKSIKTQKYLLPHWQKFKFYKNEIKISKETRLDGVFYNDEDDLKQPIENSQVKRHFIEIKNTSLRTDIHGVRHAQFPDAVTERGQKHLISLMKLIEYGHTVELIFIVQRLDVDCFSVAEQIDPDYALLFRKACQLGMLVTPLLVEVNKREIVLTGKVLSVNLN